MSGTSIESKRTCRPVLYCDTKNNIARCTHMENKAHYLVLNLDDFTLKFQNLDLLCGP